MVSYIMLVYYNLKLSKTKQYPNHLMIYLVLYIITPKYKNWFIVKISSGTMYSMFNFSYCLKIVKKKLDIIVNFFNKTKFTCWKKNNMFSNHIIHIMYTKNKKSTYWTNGYKCLIFSSIAQSKQISDSLKMLTNSFLD